MRKVLVRIVSCRSSLYTLVEIGVKRINITLLYLHIAMAFHWIQVADVNASHNCEFLLFNLVGEIPDSGLWKKRGENPKEVCS